MVTRLERLRASIDAWERGFEVRWTAALTPDERRFLLNVALPLLNVTCTFQQPFVRDPVPAWVRKRST